MTSDVDETKHIWVQALFIKTSAAHWQVGKRTLKRKLLYCLSEAARQLTIRKLKAAKVISLQQDLFLF